MESKTYQLKVFEPSFENQKKKIIKTFCFSFEDQKNGSKLLDIEYFQDLIGKFDKPVNKHLDKGYTLILACKNFSEDQLATYFKVPNVKKYHHKYVSVEELKNIHQKKFIVIQSIS